MDKKLIIFDMDGTILNTIEDITDAVNYILKKYDYPIRDINEVKFFLGNGLRKTLERSLPDNASLDMVDRLFPEFVEYYKDNSNNKTKPYDGMVDTLLKLKKEGYILAVVSNKRQEAVDSLCEKFFKNCFDIALGDRDGINIKPAPDMIDIVLEKYGLSNKDAIYIGDSDVDIKTAQNSKMDCICVTWGFRDREFLLSNGAEVLIDTPMELLKRFDSNILKNNIKAFIFDLDGTLIDTEKIYRILWPKALKSLGYEFSDERFLALRSLGRPYAPLQFKEWFGEDFDYDGARKVRKVLFDEYIKENGIQLKKGAIELLEFLHSQNIITAIATATDLERATEYLKMTGLDGYFDQVLSATMVDEGKPSPKVYEYACSQLGLKPSECVAVEDAPNGIKSAYRAGLTVIMVPDLSEPDEELSKMIDYKVTSLDKIIELYI